jgi:hypothetical protein
LVAVPLLMQFEALFTAVAMLVPRNSIAAG